MAGDTLAQVRIEVLGTGGAACVIVQEEARHALFASFLVDAVLAHFWTVFADAFHGHMLFRASFQAYPMV